MNTESREKLERQLDLMATMVAIADGNELAFALVDEPEQAAEFIAQAQAKLAAKGAYAHVIPAPADQLNTRAYLSDVAQSPAVQSLKSAFQKVALFVTGLETYRGRLRQWTAQLNVTREGFARIPHVIVFWTTEEIWLAVQEGAKDFSAWAPRTFNLDIGKLGIGKSVDWWVPSLPISQSTNLPTLPPPPRPFIGREKEIAYVLQGLKSRAWLVSIDGVGGVGKTALALQAAHQVKETGAWKHVVWATAKETLLTTRGIEPIRPGFKALDDLLLTLGEGVGQPLGRYKPEERLQAARRILEQEPILLVVDNLETVNDPTLYEFLRDLPSPSKALITSRRRLGEGERLVRLLQLGRDDSLALLRAEGKRRGIRALLQASDEELTLLYERAGGLPLALIWLVGQMAAAGYSLEKVRERLERAAGSPLIEFVFRESAALLKRPAERLLLALSLFPAPAPKKAWAKVAGITDPLTLDESLAQLENLALVNPLPTTHYTLLPLTRTFVEGELEKEPTWAADAGRRYRDYWLDYAEKHGGSQRNWRNYPRLDAEWENLWPAVRQTWEATELEPITTPPTLPPPHSPTPTLSPPQESAAKQTVRFGRALNRYLWLRGRWDERLELCSWAIAAALSLRDWSALGWRAYDTGWVHFHRADYETAEAWATCALQTFERAGAGRRDMTTAQQLQALVAQRRGDYEAAEKALLAVLEADQQTGGPDDVTIVQNDLGDLAKARGDYAAAEAWYRQALEKAQEAEYREGVAYISNNLGELALAQEDPAAARPWFEQGLAAAQEVGRVELIAGAQHGLAQVAEREGCPQEGLPLARAALETYTQLGMPGRIEATKALVERLETKQEAQT